MKQLFRFLLSALLLSATVMAPASNLTDDPTRTDPSTALGTPPNTATVEPVGLPGNVDTILQQALAGGFGGDVDRVDPHSGILRHTYVDLRLPGNGGLDITVLRSYASSNRVNPGAALRSGIGLGWRMDFGRFSAPLIKSNQVEPQPCGKLMYNNPSAQFNPVVSLPGAGHQTVTYTSATPVTMLAADYTRVLCKADVNGVVVFSPNGLRYEMTHKVEGVGNEDFITCCYERSAIHWYTTKIADRNGNNITIRYKRANSAEIEDVLASDGRRVTFEYDDSGTDTARIKSIQSGKLITRYDYEKISTAGNREAYHLKKVTLADNSSYAYEYYAEEPHDTTKPAMGASFQMKAVTVPTGGRMEYSYIDQAFPNRSNYFLSVLRERSKTAAGMATASWVYHYNPYYPNQPKQLCNYAVYECTKISGPDGDTVFYFLALLPSDVNPYWQFGLLRGKDSPEGRREIFGWAEKKLSAQTRAMDKGFFIPQLVAYSISQYGQTHENNFSQFDVYNQPQTIEEIGYNAASNTATKRATNLTYYYADDSNNWDIRKLKTAIVSDGSKVDNTYDGNGRLLTSTKNGVSTSYSYYALGNLASVTYPRNLVHSFSDYKRGIAQREEQPEGVTLTRVVNDEGTLQSQTDAEQHTTTYTYDGLNRVTSITPPQGHATSIVYETKQHTSTRGEVVEKTTLDAFGRVKTVEKNGITQSFAYDALGRKTFASLPSSTGASSDGESTSYDGLGRVTDITHADGQKVSHSYGAGSITTTNERGLQTQHLYRSYGNPEQGELMKIITPEESASITITRKDNGLLESVKQNSVTRSYEYDDRLHLKVIHHPEIGKVSFVRDSAGNMVSRKINDGAETLFDHDAHNRVWRIRYPNLQHVIKSYTKTGKLEKVAFNNIERSYTYDANDNLTSEKLALDGQQFVTTYEYDQHDFLSGITYPLSGKKLSYSPDSFGRASQISGIVNQVSYWPSGQTKQVQYANGLSSSYGQNLRLWPETFITQKADTVLDANTYEYDGVGNLTKLSGNPNASLNREFGYDKIDRLIKADATWGEGKMVYDGSGNLQTKNFGNHQLSYLYDNQQRLQAVAGTYNADFSYDAEGNVSQGRHQYRYNAASQLTCIQCQDAKKIEYRYDGANQRVAVIKNGLTSYEMYDRNGNLLLEYTPQNKRAVEHIYLHTKRIAQRAYVQ